MSTHLFNLNLEWNHSPDAIRTIKNHRIQIDNKPLLEVSAAKSFKGDPSKYNPEDLLLSSITSCHMMSYMYCCALEKITIISYKDNSEAILEVNSDGSGKITKVILKPEVVIDNYNQLELAKQLHKKASELCFIANSCNFEIVIQAVISNKNYK